MESTQQILSFNPIWFLSWSSLLCSSRGYILCLLWVKILLWKIVYTNMVVFEYLIIFWWLVSKMMKHITPLELAFNNKRNWCLWHFLKNELIFCGLITTYSRGLNQYSEAHLLYHNYVTKFYFCLSKYCMLLNPLDFASRCSLHVRVKCES